MKTLLIPSAFCQSICFRTKHYRDVSRIIKIILSQRSPGMSGNKRTWNFFLFRVFSLFHHTEAHHICIYVSFFSYFNSLCFILTVVLKVSQICFNRFRMFAFSSRLSLVNIIYNHSSRIIIAHSTALASVELYSLKHICHYFTTIFGLQNIGSRKKASLWYSYFHKTGFRSWLKKKQTRSMRNAKQLATEAESSANRWLRSKRCK